MIVIDALLLLLTFALGAALSRVSLCAVAGMQQALEAGNYAGLQRLLLAAGSAGAILLLFAGVLPERVSLPFDTALRFGMVGGGLLLGVGALINGGCYLGSVLYLGTGNMNFLFTLGGLALAARVAEFRAVLHTGAAPGLRVVTGTTWYLGLALFSMVTLATLGTARFKGRYRAVLAGLLAGVVYARHPGWSYSSVIETLVAGPGEASDWRANLAALMLFAGALAGAWLAGRFRWQPPTFMGGVRRFAGGTIMGLGAALVPGGNDTLLLWAIPGLTIYGVLAYGSMLVAIGAGLALGARFGGATRLPP